MSRTPRKVSSALAFLEKLRPGGPWVPTAIVPDGETTTITAVSADDISAFVLRHNGKRGLYYSVNPTRGPMTIKAKKTDIAAIEYLFTDLDPHEGESPKVAKKRYLTALNELQPAPAGIVDSGNGIQALFKLDQRIDLPSPVIDAKTGELVLSPEAKKLVDDVENRTKALIEKLGGKAGTQNIDRILRLPGTINLPNAKKLAEGRVACPTKLIKFNGATCKLEDFPKVELDKPTENKSIDWAKVQEQADWLKSVDSLPEDFNRKGRMIVAHQGRLKDLIFDLTEAGLISKPYQSWSELVFALAAIFKHDGRYSTEQIAAALMCPLDCNQHVTRMKDYAAKRRAVERIIRRSHAPEKQDGAPDWRETNVDGSPQASFHNARLAITTLGIECSHDLFHNELLFGYSGEEKHAIEFMLGEVTDDGIMALRQVLSQRFGFDPGKEHVRDAVISLANEHRFDPVADMLAKAEAEWDGVKRLDRMAVDYLNCEDTPFACAAVRKWMIAGVARVRHPGCKFDNVLVLESPEGFNKSSALAVLACGEENFSDERIISHASREVQEQLGGIWIHENAELAGMRKAEVEQVKAFASRQIDRARPAYGHFNKKQKRHSIEAGTTNSREYLQGQEGNRRFWTLLVLWIISTEKLQRDVLQLWGEAAHYQSKGESLVLDEALWPEAAIEQEKRRVKDPWEDVLAKELAIEDKDGKIIHRFRGMELVASTDLLLHVLDIPVAQQRIADGMRLAHCMRLLGWLRNSNGKVIIKGQQVRGYYRPT